AGAGAARSSARRAASRRGPVRLDRETRDMVRRAIREDLGRRGDITTRDLLPAGGRYRARIVAKQDGVVCGMDVAAEVFRQVCPRARFSAKARDGRRVRAGDVIAVVRGPREILSAERTALNFLQHLSGIATLTSLYAAKVRGTRARIYDTRKTLPGWRALAKYAVRTGGGSNHRMGLFDMAMLKDNHLAALKTTGRKPREGAQQDFVRLRVREFRRRHPRVPIEIEAVDEREVRLALAAGADIILLDNMRPSVMASHIRLIRSAAPRTRIETSGGVSLRDVARIARLGPDRISVGRITHSAPALDIGMDIDR
ncbi:MAG: carboxylating nicotinate-nucleotide diphosphorylase, partial [Elusimicrobiota bacterium]